jgi:acetylornithine/N-succinyldiaminopimelate aminotransferase
MMLAKGLGGGFPIGAVLATDKVAAAFTPGVHGTTFGGNPLAMACGNAVLDVILEEGFLPEVDRIARLLWEDLQALAARHPSVLAEARGAGLMLGLRCHAPNGELMKLLRDNGLLTVTAAENVVRLLPPLIIGEAQVAEAIDILDRSCAGLAQAAE